MNHFNPYSTYIFALSPPFASAWGVLRVAAIMPSRCTHP